MEGQSDIKLNCRMACLLLIESNYQIDRSELWNFHSFVFALASQLLGKCSFASPHSETSPFGCRSVYLSVSLSVDIESSPRHKCDLGLFKSFRAFAHSPLHLARGALCVCVHTLLFIWLTRCFSPFFHTLQTVHRGVLSPVPHSQRPFKQRLTPCSFIFVFNTVRNGERVAGATWEAVHLFVSTLWITSGFLL